jgi:hypothetical protein
MAVLSYLAGIILRLNVKASLSPSECVEEVLYWDRSRRGNKSVSGLTSLDEFLVVHFMQLF